MDPDSKNLVGKRIGQERKSLGLTQSELAARVSITKARLANYEDGRGCLRCGIAFDICRSLVISEKWLATGEGEKNRYLDVVSYFPKERLKQPFLDLYESDIAPVYEKITPAFGSFVSLLRYEDLHPDTWRIACFKMLNDFSRDIEDPKSLSCYWMKAAQAAAELSFYYSKAPRERLRDLACKVRVVKNGKEEPFSYERFFDDLALVGLDWSFIEQTAEELKGLERPVPIEELKERVLWALKEFGPERAEELYRKIYCGKK